jgi:hypothetical protein
MRSKLVLCAALVAAAACGKAPMRAAVDEPSPSPSPTVSPSPSESPSPAARARRLLFATKAGKKVTVKTIDLDSRAERTLFTYEERQPAEHSGNFWEELSPDIAYSAEVSAIAYGAADGLHLYDLQTGAKTTLIKRLTEERPEDDAPPTWSPKFEEGTWGFYNLRWSGDARYLSFDAAHYEGSTIDFFDRETGEVFGQKDMPYSYAGSELSVLSWSAEGASSVTTVTGDKGGLYLSAPNDPRKGKLVSVGHGHFGHAALSADGSQVAFLFNDTKEYGDRTLNGIGVVARDGTAQQVIDTGGTKNSVLIAADGQVWWTEGGTVSRWDGTSKTVAGRVDAAYVWQILAVDENTVSLAGHAEKEKRGLFVLLERGTGKALAMHGVPTDYVTYIGLI